MENIRIKFLGAAGTVTGSKILVSFNDKNILIDCGLFQGLKHLRRLNWKKLSVPAESIDLVLLTHGHLDHCGYLPCLVKAGFKGKIIGTEPTLRVAEIILRDSAKIQEEDAERANRYGYSRHKPAYPLYDLKDVERTLGHFYAGHLDEWVSWDENIRYRFRYNGHILGATFIELKIGDKILVFSGDIGRTNDPLLYAPKKPAHADYLFLESTYGSRLHPPQLPLDAIAELIDRCVARNGTIIIPSFSVERTQLLMYLFLQLKQDNRLPDIPIYMDSPMGSNVLWLFGKFPAWHKLSAEECTGMSTVIKLVKTEEETYSIAADPSPKIVIAGSGMAAGGRVLIYFDRYLNDPSATIVLAGFQAEGTRGRELKEGATEIKLFGKYYPVRATVESLDVLSAHADQGELIEWMSDLDAPPARIFLVHGEEESLHGLQQKIMQVYGWESFIPDLEDNISLEYVAGT